MNEWHNGLAFPKESLPFALMLKAHGGSKAGSSLSKTIRPWCLETWGSLVISCLSQAVAMT